MANPLILVTVVFLTVAGIAGLVIYLLSPAREKLLSDETPVNDSRVSGQWAGGLDGATPPSHNVIHHDFGGPPDGGGTLH